MKDTESDSKVSTVQGPYASTELPSPGMIIEKMVKPLKIWQFISILVVSSFSFSAVFQYLSGTPYNINLVGVSGILGLVSILICLRNPSRNDMKERYSIASVSRATEYTKTASKISLVSIFSGILVTSVAVVVHLPNSTSIDSITRVAVIAMLSVAYVFSYAVVRAVSSYAPMYRRGISALTVNNSSLPEVITFLGFTLPPIIVSYAAFIYNRPSVIMLSAEVSTFDLALVCVFVIITYISAVSRIKTS